MSEIRKISESRLRELYKRLLMVRRFEEKVDELFRKGKIYGTVHVSVGQEAVAVGVAEALRADDLVIATHRGHGHCLMRGADPRLMMAELLGKATGLCGGKGGSMHIVDAKRGMLGAMGIVGEGMPIAAGVGLALKMQKREQVCVCFFGDNASNGGPFHESLNVSALWKLPVVFVCENNLYGLSVPLKKTSAVEDIAVQAKAYDIPGIVVDGMDVLAVYDEARKAVRRARRGKGPSLLECKTYRFLGHSRGDPAYGPYRSKEELVAWKKRDPLLVINKDGRLSPEDVKEVEKEVSEMIEQAVRYAEKSPEPDAGTVLEDIYVQERCSPS
ncbi:MAG: pyruvate dehydrogenase (acetyl-transferring) E1 component subunit alpha [Deltaproteobacteria bacterium]|nr:pyruvate dehydrogenase (acetyl-transferring) E1 component subunit alpha [Deltaproteobacteria bacterium]MBW2123336.1 pyruvate dehydrogenase (acetyl-transferring) E1 component subunit alpha [Deltaproteobacteria bacterium]